MPWLRGADIKDSLLPPNGNLNILPPSVGQYELRDKTGYHGFMFADVFVVRYPTATSSDVDGAYEIDGIPPGPVQVNAMLPAAKNKTVTRQVTIKPGENVLDITLEFHGDNDFP